MNKIPRRFELDANGKTINRINLSASSTFTNITVEGKPEEIQQLVYILSTAPGSIFTTLRHPNDRLQAPIRTTVVEDILQKPVLVRTPAGEGAGAGIEQPLPGSGAAAAAAMQPRPPANMPPVMNKGPLKPAPAKTGFKAL